MKHETMIIRWHYPVRPVEMQLYNYPLLTGENISIMAMYTMLTH